MAIAVGAQEGFSWNAVAIGAISGGVSGGLAGSEGATAFFDKAFGPLAGTARGMAGSVISQGIAVATGVQSKFDWTSVAVAGVTAGVADLVGWGLGSHVTSPEGRMAVDAVADLVGGVAGAATRTALTGTDFGDNLRAVLPDVIATTIGNAILAASNSRAAEGSGSWTKDGADPIGDLVDKTMASTYAADGRRPSVPRVFTGAKTERMFASRGLLMTTWAIGAWRTMLVYPSTPNPWLWSFEAFIRATRRITTASRRCSASMGSMNP